MAETVKYYLANNIIAYPTSNSIDQGKLNIEENMASIITRITERNYCLRKEHFTLSIEPDTEYGHVIQIAEGQANIQGYHIITNDVLRVPPPTSITGTKIALGFKLARDSSQHLLGDVTQDLVTRYEGLWVSYFDKDVAYNDPDTFILGYLDWDGSNFSNVYDNPEKLGRIDAKDVICYLHDPKHPELEFMTLQDWMDIVPDWYVSKEGDVEYGAIDFLPGRLDTDDPNALEDPSVGNKEPGIHIQSETENYNIIHMISTEKRETGHYFYIINDDDSRTGKQTILDFYYNGGSRGSLYVRDPDNWLNLVSTTTLNLYGADNTNIHSGTVITNYIDGNNHLKTELTSDHYTLTNPLSNKMIDLSITSTNLKFILGDAIFNYNTATDFLTISGLERIVVEDRTQFKNAVSIEGKLYLGPDGTNTILEQNKWVLDTTNITQTFDNDGHLLKQKSGSKEPRSRWENIDGSQYTEVTPGDIKIKGPNAGITYENPNGQTIKTYIDNTGKFVISGDTYINGDLTLPAGKKVWNAVYNDLAEAFVKANKNEVIEPGDIVCVDDNGLAKKVDNPGDLLKVIGVCSSEETYGQLLGATKEEIEKGEKVAVGLAGRVFVKTNDSDIRAGDLLVAEIDGTARVRDSHDDDIDIIGMAMRKPENGKVWMKIR